MYYLGNCCRQPRSGRRQGRTAGLLGTIAVLLAVVGIASSAEAQSVETPALEIAVDYQNFQRDTVYWFHGWVVSAARPVNDYLAIVGEVGDARSREEFHLYDEFYPYVAEYQWYTFAGGVRFAWRRPRVTTFMDALVGAVMINEQFHSFGIRTYSESNGLIQYGGGADIRITGRVAARVAAKVLLVVDASGAAARLRLTAGVVVGIGRR